MVYETWSDLALHLTNSLLPLPTHLNRDRLITLSLTKRSELTGFIKRMKIEKMDKSVELARKFMRDGDSKFQSRLLKECLTLYSQSILHAPNNSPDLSAAYVRRSLVLLHLKCHKDAMRDIEMALQSGFSRKKSLENALKILHMGQYRQAMNVLYKVLMELNLIPTDHCVQEETENHHIIAGCNSKWNIPTLKNGENPEFPSSANCLQVQYNCEKGRYVIAKCDIKAGDVLFVEKAFAFTVTNSHCTDCGIRTIAPIPCLGCVDVNFCSKKCRDNAWESYHKFECDFINLIQETGIGYLALRLILKAAPNCDTLKKLFLQFTNKKEYEKNDPVTFSNDTYENVYNLQTHADSMDVEEILQYSLTATLLALCLVCYTTYAAVTEDNIKLLGQILLYHITQLICNAHAICYEKNIDDDMMPILKMEQGKYGGGIYPSVSIMNHSCDPSVSYCAYKDILIVRAKKDIEKGEEVFNSYGVDSKHMERSKRQELLKFAYFFDCRCISCSQKYDPYDVLNSMKCEKCKGPAVPDSEMNQWLSHDKRYFLCLNCESRQEIRVEQIQRLEEISILIENGKYKLENEVDVEGALRAFVKSWKLGRTILYKLHVDLYYSASLIAHCLYLLNDLKPCISFLKCVVLCAKGRYGSQDSMHMYLTEKLVKCILLYADVVKKT